MASPGEDHSKSAAECGKKKHGLLGTIFMFPDGYDVALMIFGFLGSIGDGMTVPVLLLLYSRLMNTIGAANTSLPSSFALHIKQNALLLCYLACGQWVSCFLEGYCWTRTSERQASRLRIHYLKAVLRQDMGYFDLHVSSTAEVIASVSSDTLIIQDVIAEKIPVFLMHLSTFIGGYAIGFLILWKLAIVGLPFVVLLVIPGLIYGRTLVNIGRQLRDEYNKADIVVEQAVSSIRTVYSFSSEDKIISDYSKALHATVKLGLRQGLAKGLAIGSNGVIFAIWAFISYYGSRLVMYHGAQGGTVFAVGAAMIVGGLAFGSSLSNIKYFSEASAAGERILEVITRVPKIDSDNTEGLTLETVSGEIEFKHVEFAYPSRPNTIIFKDFNMKVPAGKTVALIGGSGSGKSTVFALLQRFYDPIDGEILLDALPVDKMELKWLRSKIGLVSQEPALFGTTIKENILFGKENASSLEMIEAAKDANAHNFISQLPNGYDTQVGERGTQLSGGQKQRIAIARALVKEPKIMLLDEATSALDSESECIVQEALDRASVGRTTIIIAHRLSTIRQAEFIMVLQNGLIKEAGSHDELMTDDDGLYASLVRLQQDNRNDKLANADDCGGVSSANSLNNEIHSISSRRLSVVSRTSSAGSTAQSRHMEATVFHPKQAFPAPSFRRLLAMNLPEWRQAISGCISAALFGAVQPVYAFALGAMIFAYFLPYHGDIKRETRKYALWFLALAVFSFLVNLIQHYSFAAMGEYLTKRIRERMLRKILTFEVGWFDQEDNSTGAVCSRLANDAKVVRSLVGDRMALLIQTFSAVAIACTMGLVIAWKLALVMISLQPLIIMCFYFKKSMFQSMSKKSIKAQEESSKLAAEAVSNLTTITSFSCQARILQMLEKAQESPTRENIRQSWFAGVVLATSQSLGTCTWALDFWYGGKLMVEGYIGAKAVLQTFLILISTGKVIAEAGNMTSDLVKGANAVGSVFAILDKHSFIEPDDIDGHRPEKLTGKIEFSRVHFAYPTRPSVIIFQGFSINIETGKSTALVGRSGSGKSTIIGLIQRFYDPIKGEVRIDGLDIKSYHLQSLRKRIALVSQEPTLFNGTIRDNILYGAPDNTNEAQMMEAANAANAHNFIAGLQDGYDTLCGDRGTQLSGGQKQRIAIARAMLKNPEILLLDEATSALDSRSEKVLQDALDKLIGGRTTTLVVSHRLCSIQNCDLIAVLDKKKVVETGTHSSLMAKGQSGVYRRLVSLQASQLSIT